MDIEGLIEQILIEIEEDGGAYIDTSDKIKLEIELLKTIIEYEKIKNENTESFKNSKTRKISILKEE